MSDTIAALQQALTPKSGMQRIPLSLESYQHPSPALSSKLLLNMFAEQQPADARVAAALVPTAGLAPVVTLGTGPIWALNDDLPGAIFVVSGTHFYKVYYDLTTGALTPIDLGDVGTPSGGQGPGPPFYSIAVGPTAAVVCVPPNAYVSPYGGPVMQITGTWPDYGASSVTYLDGYFVFTAQLDPTRFFITTLGDPTAVDALDYASLDAFPNAVHRVMTLGTDLWFAGLSGWEIWYDSGNQDFPFRRRPNGILQRGVGIPQSIAKGDDSLFWWSTDRRLYRTAGYQARRISTHAIEAQTFNGNIVAAFSYAQLGHIFYGVTTPTQTLVYDTLTQAWHNASSSADGSGPFRATCATKSSDTLFGDGTSGNLCYFDASIATDCGVEVKRQVVLPPIYPGTRRAFCARLEIEMEVGTFRTPETILLEWSDDGGITYTGSRVMTVHAPYDGAAVGTRRRVYTTRLGSFRNRVFRLTSQQVMTIYALEADITGGAS